MACPLVSQSPVQKRQKNSDNFFVVRTSVLKNQRFSKMDLGVDGDSVHVCRAMPLLNLTSD